MRRLFAISPVLLIAAAAVLAVSLCFLVGCNSNSLPKRIFLITLDTTRADSIDLKEPGKGHTPNLARLAAEGAYYENAFSLIPITLPSHASMFYSLPPHRLKIYNNGQVRNVHSPSLAQLLAGKDFFTAAVIALGVLKSDFLMNKGFQMFIETFKPYLWERRADEVTADTRRLIEKIETGKTGSTHKRSFYWVHYADPHEPYFPPCKDGMFTLFLNGKTLFSCHSTEWATVSVQLDLKPGENRLHFAVTLPAAFDKFQGTRVEYIKYKDFRLQTSPAEGGGQTVSPVVTYPEDWTEKKDKQTLHRYSSGLHSVLLLTNPGKKNLAVKLDFLYQLHLDKESNKRFYREEVSFMDAQIGELTAYLKEKGWYEDSAFVIMGDHGEGLGEYNEHFGHIHYLNGVYSRVPLILAGKGITQRGKQELPVSNLHIAPTILDLAGVKKPSFMLGQSLLGKVEPKTILLETYAPEAYFDAFSLVDYPWQAVFYPGRAENKMDFYNLQTDPLGVTPLDAARIGETGKAARANLVNSLLNISRIITATKGKIGKSSPRHREILKSLGYL